MYNDPMNMAMVAVTVCKHGDLFFFYDRYEFSNSYTVKKDGSLTRIAVFQDGVNIEAATIEDLVEKLKAISPDAAARVRGWATEIAAEDLHFYDRTFRDKVLAEKIDDILSEDEA